MLIGTAPHLASQFIRVADGFCYRIARRPTRRRLRSASTDGLTVPAYRLSAAGESVLSIAGARILNGLLHFENLVMMMTTMMMMINFTSSYVSAQSYLQFLRVLTNRQTQTCRRNGVRQRHYPLCSA